MGPPALSTLTLRQGDGLGWNGSGLPGEAEPASDLQAGPQGADLLLFELA
jgi:hypothetical protein